MPIEWMQVIGPMLTRVALKHEQSINHLEAASFRHVQMPAKHEVVQSMQLTAKYYGAEAARIRKDMRDELAAGQTVEELETLGMPHPHVWMALVGSMANQGERIGQANRQKIQAYLQTTNHEKPSNSKLADAVRHCRVQSTCAGTK